MQNDGRAEYGSEDGDSQGAGLVASQVPCARGNGHQTVENDEANVHPGERLVHLYSAYVTFRGRDREAGVNHHGKGPSALAPS